MKRFKFLICVMLAVSAGLFQSCLKDQEDIFDKSSSNRMDDYLVLAKTTLLSSEQGWVFEYYPHENQIYGGFVYTLKFNNDGTVVARKEGVENAETSGYSLKSDDGPVLSFDTYSDLLHEYSTPSSKEYQAKHGDFEFVIDSIGQDVIKVHGKRGMNILYLYRLTESPESYLDKVKEQAALFWYDHTEGNIGTEQDRQTYDLASRQIKIGGNEVAYVFTDKGIRLYKSVTVGGKNVRTFDNDDASMELKCTDEGASDVVLKGTLSPEYFPGLLGSKDGYIITGDEGISKFMIMSHLKEFSISKQGDWFTLGQEGNKVKMTVTPNNTGHVRTGKIDYALGDAKGTVNLVQSNFEKDVVGDYELHYTSGGEEYIADAWIAADKKLYIMMDKDTLYIPLGVYDESYIEMESGQFMGTTKSESGNTLYLYDLFLDESGNYWTGYNPGNYYGGQMVYDEKTAKQTCTFAGTFSKYTVGFFSICAFTSKNMSAANWYDYWWTLTHPYLVKKN